MRVCKSLLGFYMMRNHLVKYFSNRKKKVFGLINKKFHFLIMEFGNMFLFTQITHTIKFCGTQIFN